MVVRMQHTMEYTGPCLSPPCPGCLQLGMGMAGRVGFGVSILETRLGSRKSCFCSFVTVGNPSRREAQPLPAWRTLPQ
jgi:hypothetical protein